MLSDKEVMPLGGAIKKVDFPTWTWDDWKQSKFQNKQELATVKNFGFHSILIRAHNQWNFAAWGKLRVQHVVSGKDNYLFGQGYIDGYYGNDYTKRSKRLNEKKEAIKAVCEAFKERGKEVVFMIQPGKSFLYPEKIPAALQKPLLENNIYTSFKEWASSEDLSIIDFQTYFIDHKEELPHPIFPKLGTHLSRYAETIVLDSILNFIENRSGKDLYQYHFTEPIITNKPRGRDNDTEKALNLFFPLESEPLAYNYFKLDSIQKEGLPNILVIGDSFYWGLYPIVNQNGLFGQHQFWYRNHAIFPNALRDKKEYSNKKTCRESLEKFDMVFIIVTSMAMDQSGWGYFEEVYDGIEK